MKSNAESRQNSNKYVFAETRAKTLTPGKSSLSKRGLKEPSEEMAKIIRLVNLVPKGVPLPRKPFDTEDERELTRDEFEARIQLLPPRLAAYLMGLLSNKHWWAVVLAYDEVYSVREVFYGLRRLAQTKEIQYLRECRNCEQMFFAGRETQVFCPETSCASQAKKKRQEKWLAGYEEKHGHAYRQPQRKPPHVEKIRRIMKRLWPNTFFERNYENEKEIAAQADITVKQCQVALDYLTSAQTKKRAKTARER